MDRLEFLVGQYADILSEQPDGPYSAEASQFREEFHDPGFREQTGTMETLWRMWRRNNESARKEEGGSGIQLPDRQLTTKHSCNSSLTTRPVAEFNFQIFVAGELEARDFHKVYTNLSEAISAMLKCLAVGGGLESTLRSCQRFNTAVTDEEWVKLNTEPHLFVARGGNL